MTGHGLRERLLLLALLAMPFHAVEAMGSFQPSELLALPLLLAAGASVLARERLPLRSVVDAGVLLWLAAVAVGAGASAFRAGGLEPAVAREMAVTAYLATLYFAIRVVAARVSPAAVAGGFVVSAALAGGLGVLGFVANSAGFDTPLAFAADTPYPYLGAAARAKALTARPNMLASLLALALLLLAAGAPAGLPRRARIACAVLASVGLAATLSKTAVALAGGLTVVAFLSTSPFPLPRAKRLALSGGCLSAAVVYAAIAHVVVLPEAADRSRLEAGMFLAGPPLVRFELPGGRWAAYPTNYFFNKRASGIAVARSWPWGIGPGLHPAFAEGLKAERLYPATQWAGTPHSSYAGAVAEMGLAGGLGLLGFLWALGRGIRLALARGRSPFAVAAAGFVAMLLVEAIATDVMHYRHLAWMAALVAAAGSGEALQSRPG